MLAPVPWCSLGLLGGVCRGYGGEISCRLGLPVASVILVVRRLLCLSVAPALGRLSLLWCCVCALWFVVASAVVWPLFRGVFFLPAQRAGTLLLPWSWPTSTVAGTTFLTSATRTPHFCQGRVFTPAAVGCPLLPLPALLPLPLGVHFSAWSALVLRFLPASLGLFSPVSRAVLTCVPVSSRRFSPAPGFSRASPAPLPRLFRPLRASPAPSPARVLACCRSVPPVLGCSAPCAVDMEQGPEAKGTTLMMMEFVRAAVKAAPPEKKQELVAIWQKTRQQLALVDAEIVDLREKVHQQDAELGVLRHQVQQQDPDSRPTTSGSLANARWDFTVSMEQAAFALSPTQVSGHCAKFFDLPPEWVRARLLAKRSQAAEQAHPRGRLLGCWISNNKPNHPDGGYVQFNLRNTRHPATGQLIDEMVWVHQLAAVAAHEGPMLLTCNRTNQDVSVPCPSAAGPPPESCPCRIPCAQAC